MPTLLEALRPYLKNPASHTRIEFKEQNLTGCIPPEIGLFTNITQLLRLHHNNLTGIIPPEIGKCTNLRIINLSANNLTGGIPVEISRCSDLAGLYLWRNSLSGDIPPELGLCTKLRELNIENNTFTGKIPKEIGNLSKLEDLRLQDNKLALEIPPEIFQCTALVVLNMSQNQLVGRIPAEIGNCTALKELRLRHNRLSGPIPPDIRALQNLTILNLAANELSGSIPAEIAALENLKGLYLWKNLLTGSIPKELGKLSSLEEINLEDNMINDEIPVELADCDKLRDIRVQNNKLSGEVPHVFIEKFGGVFVENYFNTLPAGIEIPEKWKADDYNQVAEKIETTRDLEVKEWFAAEGISSRAVDVMRLLIEDDQYDVFNGMVTGKIPIGFSENPIWFRVSDKLRSLPKKAENAANEEKAIQRNIERTKAQIERLEESLLEEKRKLAHIKKTREVWKYCEEECLAFLPKAEILTNHETTVANEMNAVLESDPEDFVAQHEEGVKLSLVFNAVGLREEIVKAACELDGYEFLTTALALELPMVDLKDVEYLKHMMLKKQIPFTKHLECCAVCQSDSSQSLVELCEEHSLEIDGEIVTSGGITGPRMLMLKRKDFESYLGLDSTTAKQIERNVVRYLNNLHREALKYGDS